MPRPLTNWYHTADRLLVLDAVSRTETNVEASTMATSSQGMPNLEQQGSDFLRPD